MGRWFRAWVWLLLCLSGIGFFFGSCAYLWLRFTPPPSLPESRILPPVTRLVAVAGQGIITLDWPTIPNAVSYQVLRSDKPAGPFALVSSPYGATPLGIEHAFERLFPGEPFGRLPYGPFVDSDLRAGHTYYYRVRANDGSAWSPQGTSASATAFTPSTQTPIVHLRVDASKTTGPLEHKWEISLGSEHLSYMLKGDINAHLKAVGQGLRAGNKLAHDQLGIQYIRAHGILMDDPSVYTEDSAGTPHYDFSKVDKLYDILRQDGLKPYVELSFMPSDLAANTKSPEIFKYRASSSPPKDYAKWQALVAALAQHLIQRYGKEEVESWPFEVWNEPDLNRNPIFWNGSRDDYFRLYDYSAAGLKSIDPRLQIGGPVSAFAIFQEEFLRHVTSHHIPLDFLDLHTYYMPAADYRPLLHRYGLDNVPVYYTEWGVSPQYGDSISDMAFAAAATISGLHDSLDHVDRISYWTASDYFEESGDPAALFHGGFGLIGLDQLRKPRYWAYYLLHQLGNQSLALTGSGDGYPGLIKGFAATNTDGTLAVLLSNATLERSKAAGSTPLARQVSLTIAGLTPGKAYRIDHDRIDNHHSNVYAAWKDMGSPRWPNAAQMATLHQKDALEAFAPGATFTANTQGEVTLDFDLPMPAVSFIKLTPAQ